MQVCVRCETPFPGALDSPATDGLTDLDAALPRPAAPSGSQSHGTLMALLASGFVITALLLWLSVRDIGPFTARYVSATAPASGSAVVTIQITNEGERDGRGKCLVELVFTQTGDARSPFQFLSEKVPANGSIEQKVTVPLDPGVAPSGTVTC